MNHTKLVLILARDLADKLASAMFVVDEGGTLVYYNEPAADILGRPFSDVGRMPADEWVRAFAATDLDGRPLAPDELPLMAAIEGRRPAHRPFRITGADGELRTIAVTAFPLFARTDVFAGAAAIFWNHDDADADRWGR